MSFPARGRALASPLPIGLLSDERLARLVGEGQERAFATLYDRYHPQLYRYCHSMVRHEADAQDALQSTFTAALGALRRARRDAPLKPWLFRIAHNESISLLRRRRAQDELADSLESPALSVEAAAEERERLNELVADLQALPDRQRGALVMRELSGLSHEELAAALGISVGAAKQTVFEARQTLQEFADGRAMPCSEIQRLISDGDGRALRGRRVRAHLRGCAECAAFARAIPKRREALLALSPMLPATAAAGLLARITGTGPAYHGGGGLLAGATGKSVGVAVSAKTVATGMAIMATATVGAVGAVEAVDHVSHHSKSAARLTSSSLNGPTASGRSGPATGSGAGVSAAGSRPPHGHGSQVGASQPGSFQSRAAARSHHAGAGASQHFGGKQQTAAGGGAGPSGSAGAASGTGDPQGNGVSPNAGGTNPNAHGGNPNSRSGSAGGNPNAHGGNPNAHGGNPNAGGGNAVGSSNVGVVNTNAHGGNPNAGGGNPNARGGNSSAGSTSNSAGGSTNAHGANPNAGSGNPHGRGGH